MAVVSAKRAFVVGINGYKTDVAKRLKAAMFDAIAIKNVLAPDANDVLRGQTWYDASTPRWKVELWCDRSMPREDFRADLMKRRALHFFDADKEDVEGADLLFYFSGHAARKGGSVVLLGPDGDGIALTELMTWASNAIGENNARTVTIILDCCLSGAVAGRPHWDPSIPIDIADIPPNCSILTATSPTEEAKENSTHGVFTQQILGGLKGAAADILGDVTPSSLYSHTSLALSDFAQRPAFKSYVKDSTPVLTCARPTVKRVQIVELARLFPAGTDSVSLDWHHEGVPTDWGFVDRQSAEYEAFKTGSQWQRDLDFYKVFRNSHLLRTVDDRDFYFVCTEPPKPGSGQSDRIELTPLGKIYRDLVVSERITKEPEETVG